jgi:DNA-binding CsgD family transcriptional regulator
VTSRNHLIQVAETVCTEKELEALAYHLADVPTSQIALALGISRQAVRHRLDNARRKITTHAHTYPEEAA